jgi:hypothetical protein
MENLESILAENMRRFNTKNLNEITTAAENFIAQAKQDLKLGYNFVAGSKLFGDNTFSYNSKTNEMEEWANAHILYDTRNMLIQGQMASYKFEDASGQPVQNPIKKWIPQPLTLIQPDYTKTARAAVGAPIKWIDAIGMLMTYMDSKAIIAGGKQFLDALKIQSPPMATNQDLFKLVQVKRNDKNWMYGWSINKYAVYTMYGFKPVEPK